MWRWYTAEDRRQTAAVVLLLTVCGLTLAAAAPIFAGLAMSMIGTGSLGAASNPGRWPVIVSGLWTRPHDPAAAFSGASFSPSGFWLLASAVLLVSLGAYGWFASMGFRILAPTGTGFASRADIARDLSLSACRRRAKITRPDLDRRHRASAPAAQVAIPLHEAPVSRSPLWLPLENATGVPASSPLSSPARR